MFITDAPVSTQLALKTVNLNTVARTAQAASVAELAASGKLAQSHNQTASQKAPVPGSSGSQDPSLASQPEASAASPAPISKAGELIKELLKLLLPSDLPTQGPSADTFVVPLLATIPNPTTPGIQTTPSTTCAVTWPPISGNMVIPPAQLYSAFSAYHSGNGSASPSVPASLAHQPP